MKSGDQSFMMNGVIIEETPKSIISNALLLMHDDFKYRSKDNLIETLIGINDLVIEWLKKQNRKTTKYQKGQTKLYEKASSLSHAQVLQIAYNEILKLHDLGTLQGFGLANKFKDGVPGNPEIMRVTKIKL